MSKNIDQVFIANPITSNAATDLMYFGQSPYAPGNDAAMTFSNFSAQFTLKVQTTKGDLIGYSTLPVRVAVGSNGQLLQSDSTAASGISWTTTAFPTTAGALGSIIISNGTNWITSTSLWPNTVGSNGVLLQSNGTSNTYTTATYPSIATSSGTILRANGTNWVASTSTFADTYGASTILYSNGVNTVTGLATANSSVLVTTSSGVPVQSGTLSNGQMIIGSTGATPVVGTITTSGNISITTGAGTVALAGTGPASFTWNDVAGTSQAASAYSGYIISNAGQTTVTLPATAAEGTLFSIAGKGAAGWILQANTGQTIHYGSAATTSAGSLTSTNQWDSVQIVCVTANTTFSVIASQGTLTVA